MTHSTSIPRVRTIKWKLSSTPVDFDLARHGVERAGATIARSRRWIAFETWHVKWPKNAPHSANSAPVGSGSQKTDLPAQDCGERPVGPCREW